GEDLSQIRRGHRVIFHDLPVGEAVVGDRPGRNLLPAGERYVHSAPEDDRITFGYEILDFNIASALHGRQPCLEASQINVAQTAVDVIRRNQFVDQVDSAATRNRCEEATYDRFVLINGHAAAPLQ